MNQTVALLAARAPKLRQAVRDAKKAEHAYVVLDRTLIPIDQAAADRPFYSGKGAAQSAGTRLTATSAQRSFRRHLGSRCRRIQMSTAGR